VVGGGVIGTCAAHSLARAGAEVVVLDPAPGRGASWGNAGLVVPSYALPLATPDVLRSLLGAHPEVTFGRPLPLGTLLWLGRFALAARPGRAWRVAERLRALAEASRRLYDELAIPLCATGLLHVARDEETWRAECRAARRLAAIGVRSEELDPDALARAEPGLAAGAAGAIRFPDDRSLDPERATAALAAAAVAHGAEYRPWTVTGVVRTAGRVTAVETDHGLVRGRAFVIAAGAASARVGRLFGARLPVEAAHGWSLTIPAAGPLLAHPVVLADEQVVVNAGPDRVRLTGGLEFGGPRAAGPDPRAVARLREAANRAVPALADIAAPGVPWRGARPMTPDGLPLIRVVADGVVAATGHGTLGMTLAPATGRIVTALVGGSAATRTGG